MKQLFDVYSMYVGARMDITGASVNPPNENAIQSNIGLINGYHISDLNMDGSKKIYFCPHNQKNYNNGNTHNGIVRLGDETATPQ
jgi:hypothetical protein